MFLIVSVKKACLCATVCGFKLRDMSVKRSIESYRKIDTIFHINAISLPGQKVDLRDQGWIKSKSIIILLIRNFWICF